MNTQTKHAITQIFGTIGFAFLYSFSNLTGSSTSAKYVVEMYEKWSSQQIESWQQPALCDSKPSSRISST